MTPAPRTRRPAGLEFDPDLDADFAAPDSWSLSDFGDVIVGGGPAAPAVEQAGDDTRPRRARTSGSDD